MKTSKITAFFSILGVLFGLLIYWREADVRGHVNLLNVILWQIGIWIPWILGFKLFEKAIYKTRKTKLGLFSLFVYGILWVTLHYGWFFFLSTKYSPYLGLPNTRYGVYPYFFIFWTLTDIGLMWFIIDKLQGRKKDNHPLLVELTRGGKKYYCEPGQIYWLAAENYYTKLFTSEGVFVMRKPLKYFQDVLPYEMFKKIHRSTIINLNYVSELVRGGDHRLEVVMKDGARHRVSRTFSQELNLFFKQRAS